MHFPVATQNRSSLAEQLKAALVGETGIKVNEIRYVAEDSSVAGIKTAANLAAKVLGTTGDKFQDLFNDPNRLLQMILAAESSRGGGGSGTGAVRDLPVQKAAEARGHPVAPAGLISGNLAAAAPAGERALAAEMGRATEGGAGFGSGSWLWAGEWNGNGWVGIWSGRRKRLRPRFREWDRLWAETLRSRASQIESLAFRLGAFENRRCPGSPESMLPATSVTLGATYSVAEEDIRSVLSLFSQLGKSRKNPDARMDMPTFQSRLSAMPVRAQYTLQQALAGLAAQAPTEAPDKPMLLKLAEHVAIRFALDSYERGELRVNAVKQLLDRMNTEIEALRKILGTQEEMMASAGLSVQSHTELLDQEFWEQVPEENKKEVLTSEEAWCVPPRNIRVYLEDMLRRGELKTVNEVLLNYATCIAMEAPEARRTTAIGISDLAELYGSGDGSALMDAIRRTGKQLAVEREPELQMLVGATFVRLSQEAAAKRCYAAIHQALASLESIEIQRPGATQNLRPRIGAEERLPEFVEEALRDGQLPDGLPEILALMPQATLQYLTNRFGHCGFREDCEMLGTMARGFGDDATQPLD